jgi:hypothetical protein
MTIPPFISSDSSQALSLSEIASWDPDTSSDIEPAIRTSVPSLQRGLVWRPLHSPAEVESFLKLPEREFENWHWWRLSHAGGDLKGAETRRDTWEAFLKFRDNGELLLYAQRSLLAKRFPDYDPARRELWDSHNRPWDFDHILGSYYLYYGRGGFKAICDEWAPTIANLRAWPFEDNLSDSQQSAKVEIEGPHGTACR